VVQGELSRRFILGVHEQGLRKSKQQRAHPLASAAQIPGQTRHAEAGNRIGGKRSGILHQHDCFPEAPAAVVAGLLDKKAIEHIHTAHRANTPA